MNTKREKKPQEAIEYPPLVPRLPWESQEEYSKFFTFLHTSHPRSIRKAYQAYCEHGGREPKQNPPSSWYDLAQGMTLVIRKTINRLAAIDKAGKVGRYPEWETIGAIVQAAIEDGELDQTIYCDPGTGDTMREIKVIEIAFESLAIDLDGNPLPGVPTWEELYNAARAEHDSTNPPEGR